MRKGHYLRAFGGLVGALAVASLGCSHYWEDYYEPLTDPKLATGGGDGGTPKGCIPSESNKPVEDTCGIFVSSSKGKDGDAGTKSAPVKALQQAIDKAQGRPVYACAEAFAGSVTLASGSAIYGGLDCSEGWAYVGVATKSALMGEADKVALAITKDASGAEVVDFTIQAANAATPGSSSIAVLALAR